MKTTYNHNQIEPKWQAAWEKAGLFQHSEQQSVMNAADKMYLLFAFAYPSGSGLHVGHVESKTALDILARYYRMNGKQVFFPVGWDAFGLPAENYAVKTGVHPSQTTVDAINTFRRQLKRIGISYDWANEIATSHPGYYQWTQWLFLQLYQAGLAYKKPGTVNWCPSCQTVLANEQVVEGLCERCDTEVSQREMDQWYFKITDYTEELISGLEEVDWPAPTKQQQLNWIGKKKGLNITYPVVDKDGNPVTLSKDQAVPSTVTCFTTRPDTNFGATFVVLGPEHPLVDQIHSIAKDDKQREIEAYVKTAINKKEIERVAEGKKKTGVFTGYFVQQRLTGELLPLYISDFVLGHVGTGAVVGVPGHDLRDFDFAKQMGLPIRRVVIGPDGDESDITRAEQVQESVGRMVNSGFLDGVKIEEAIENMMDHLEKEGLGERVVSYKLRDWLISRQRYWGAPIPIVYDPEGNPHPVKEEHLPWTLPEDVDYNPKGKSPLASSKEFFVRTEKLYGKGWTPEVDTMDTFVCSSWYYFRYLSSRDKTQFMDKKMGEQWLPVDFYMIGPEHIVLHLLYARFFTKFLRDQGYLRINEPFLKMRHQGMILGPDGKKMSKSKGNVINPDEIVKEFGADTLRMYEMFMGPIDADKPWNPRAVAGVNRFLGRFWRLSQDSLAQGNKVTGAALSQKLQATIKKVTDDIPKYKFNTAIASMMELVNDWQQSEKTDALSIADVSKCVRLLAPFAPFISEELWSQLGTETGSIHTSSWPTFDASLLSSDTMTVVVQVNGKVRSRFELETSKIETITAAQLVELAMTDERLVERVDSNNIKKTIWIPPKGSATSGLLSLVV